MGKGYELYHMTRVGHRKSNFGTSSENLTKIHDFLCSTLDMPQIFFCYSLILHVKLIVKNFFRHARGAIKKGDNDPYSIEWNIPLAPAFLPPRARGLL